MANKKGKAGKTSGRRGKAKASIYERIFNVQQGVKVVMKSGKNTYHKYDYATERDVLAEIKPLLKEQRLVVLENAKEHVMLTDKKHKIGVEFTIVNLDNTDERDVSTFYGVGEDKEGTVVGLPIAYTMAQKYFAAKKFLLETGDDPEADQNTDSGIDTRTRKQREKDAKSGGDMTQEIETVKRMIAGSRNIQGLLEYKNKRLPESQKFNKAQKEEIGKLVEKRVAELQEKEGKTGDSVVDALMDVANEGKGGKGQKKLL